MKCFTVPLSTISTLILLSVTIRQSDSRKGEFRDTSSLQSKAATTNSADTSFTDIAFDLPDLAVNVETLEGQFLLEAFKSVDNERILNEAGVPRASQLVWVSVGQPVPVLTSGERTPYRWTSNGFNIHFQMLTDAQRRILAQTAAKKYGVKVEDSQIISLALSKFQCSFPVYDADDNKYLIKGAVTDFRTFPLRMDFPALPKSTERQLLESLLQQNHGAIDIHMTCSMASRGKKLITNTLSITSKQLEQIGLSEKLFGPSSSGNDTIYVCRKQTAELSRELYSTLNIVEEYEMPESAFSEAFVAEFIRQTASSIFSFVPTEQALKTLSKYTLDFSEDIKPDIIKRELSSILKTQSYGNKSRIVLDETYLQKLKEENKEQNSHRRSMGIFNIFRGSKWEKWARENSRSSDTYTKSLDDQLKELNSASKSDIKWEFEGKKIVPKSLNVARLLRSNFDKTLTFRRVRIEKLDAPFNLEFSVYTSRVKASTPQLDRLNDRVTTLSEEVERLSKEQSSNLRLIQKVETELKMLISNVSTNLQSDIEANTRSIRQLKSAVGSQLRTTLKRCRLCVKQVRSLRPYCRDQAPVCTAWSSLHLPSVWTKPTPVSDGCQYRWMIHCITKP